MKEMLVGALVWSVSIALVSGRVGGTFLGVLRLGEESSSNATLPASDMRARPLPPADASANAMVWMNALLIVTAVALSVAIVVLVFMIRRLHHRRHTVLIPESPWKSGGRSNQPSFHTTCPLLKREELEAACEDFSNIIGSSPDGFLYKGTLSDGTEIAVTSIRMCAADWSPKYELSFRRKVEGLSRMKHKHLVNLVGYCVEEEPFTRMLVFEYASNGTLSDHLHNPKEMEHLDWPTRMRVIMGAAYGLEYMHHDLTPPCSHLNFDANAIYLTDEHSAKIANFGIARMSAGNPKQDQMLHGCNSWMGCTVSEGYSEEWDGLYRHCPGFEGNMYDFGVFILQTISGRPPYCELEQENLVNWAERYLSDPKLMLHLVDPELKLHNAQELVALCKIVQMCLSDKGYKRPSMRKVSRMLAEALNMTPEAATMRASPLLWAQLSILDDST
ncbi:protein MALE DISCOVERER 2 [Physcomitrium patens]|uniref:Protein kinase domain-containing protein n=1 Tax=Physcomitrium patens TaxID=3218 RepID=A0A2K1KCJ3_PHYPA|nr:protein MALE DISCOVERER 2-like [Physcomitrium patens]PNR51506.1 hypothetical protein PHYPA_010693 [Physcomitrium patens]|eukprot:XP_024379737.1 protein MALE DISCOVERER 2-like [Physcomitrella patens]